MSSTNQQKYESVNPLRKIFLRPFQRRFVTTITTTQPQSLLEVGCGEGFLLTEIQAALPATRVVGMDVVPEFVHEGHRLFPGLDLRVGDIYHINQPDQSWDTVVASEVLEHLERPAQALAELARVAKRHLVLSVPWEPWFQAMNFARGQHLRRWGNHPEHINHWSPKTFEKLVGQYAKVTQVKTSLPWIILVAQV